MEHLVQRDKAFDLYSRSAERVKQLLTQLSVLPPETPIPHLEWTLGDLALHLVQAAEIAGELLEGKSSPFTDMQRIAEVNAALLAQRSDRQLPALAEEFATAIDRMVQRFREMPDDVRVPFHAGLSFTPPQAMAMMSSELLVHGWDLAQVSGEEWEIDPAGARLIIYTILTVMPRMVDQDAARGLVATYELRIRDGACFRLHFENGNLAISEVAPGGPADCRIAADASAFLLMGYGRGSQIKPMLTGKVIAWGRKPWLAGKFTTLLKSP